MFLSKLVRLCLATLVVSSLTLASLAQEPAKKEAAKASPGIDEQISPDDVVRISTNLVQFDVVVTDRKGRVVRNLQPEDFQLKVSGASQPITYFSYVAVKSEDPSLPAQPPAVGKKGMPPPPGLRLSQAGRVYGLVFDDFCMSVESIHHTRRTLNKFVDEMAPNDVAAIISSYAGTGTLQQFTPDKRQLRAAIERIRWHRCPDGDLISPNAEPAMNDMVGQSDSLNGEDSRQNTKWNSYATLKYVVRGLRDLPGRKSIVLLSDGLRLNGGDLARLIEQANRASVVIYTIHMRGVDTLYVTAADDPKLIATLDPKRVNNPHRGFLASRREAFYAGQGPLVDIAKLTGGFNLRNSNDFFGGMQRVAEDQKGYYLIGYRPDEATFDPQKGPRQFNSIKITLKGHDDLQVRSRGGFMGVVDQRSLPGTRSRAEQLIAALQSPLGTDGIKLLLTSFFTNEPAAGSILRSMLHLDARDLSFTREADGSWLADIDVVAVTMTGDGAIADQITKNQTIRVRADKYQQLLDEGIIYAMDLPLKKAGGYELRIAIRDRGSDKLGSARQFVEVPHLDNHGLALSGMVVTGREANTNAGPGKPISAPDFAFGPAVRRFRAGMTLDYGLVVYNATALPGSLPQLKTEIRLYRDGREIWKGPTEPIAMQQQRDLQRITATGNVKLDDKLAPGWYSLEVVVVDLLGRKSRNTVTQWVDFEIVD